MKAIVLSIGDELVLGQTVDTNAAWLSDKLARRGIGSLMHITVADDRAAIAEAIREAVRQADLVIATGGLGPTEDDLTRYALADVMAVELKLDEVALAQLESFFEKIGRPMAQRNRVQVMCPVGAKMLENPAGTAPGIYAQINGKPFYSVPGVPREMIALWSKHIEPALPTQTGRVILTAKINTFGQGESDVAEILGDLMDRHRNPTVGTTVANGIVSTRIRSEGTERQATQAALSDTIKLVEKQLGKLAFGRDETTLADAVGAMLKAHDATLATAESCTGGLIAKMLTDQPGASLFYYGGWITYANDAKANELGVRLSLIEEQGAVSEPVAIALAKGALQRSDADMAISITGIAGPDGGNEEKPVGTVWFALARPDREPITRCHIFPGDRGFVRLRAANYALNMVRLALLNDQRG